MSLIATGKAPESILQQIAQRETQIVELEKDRAELETVMPNELDLRRTKKDLFARMANFKDLMHKETPVARQVLKKLLSHPLLFNPACEDGKNIFTFDGAITTSALLNAPGYIRMASPRGFEPLLPP